MPFKHPKPFYSTWQNMKNRCRSPNDRAWANYGGRGIKVCDRWTLSYDDFVSDIGPKPGPEYTLDRVDNDGDYTPENIQWSTRSEQQINRRTAVIVTIEGVTYRAADLAKKIGVRSSIIKDRSDRGLSLEKVLSNVRIKPTRKVRDFCKNGHPFTDSNTYICKHGWMHCRACQNAKMRRINEAKRLAKAIHSD